jgi:hypothetical protein
MMPAYSVVFAISTTGPYHTLAVGIDGAQLARTELTFRDAAHS